MNHVADHQLLARQIRLRRRVLGISQERLAELAGLDRKTVNRIEVGRTSPQHDILMDIAEALGCPVRDLIG